MADTTDSSPPWMPKLGMVFTVLPSLAFLLSASMKLSLAAPVVQMLGGPNGFSATTIRGIGVLEALCVILYLAPQTAVLGAVLLTGYLGGAVDTHLRTHQPVFLPIVIGVLVWGGIYLREPRVRALMPLRHP